MDIVQWFMMLVSLANIMMIVVFVLVLKDGLDRINDKISLVRDEHYRYLSKTEAKMNDIYSILDKRHSENT